jgi:prolyl oligopeptidase
LVRYADTDLTVPRPALLYGYANGGAFWTPFYLGPYSAFLDAGGVYVHVNARGGGEHGQEFKEQGNLQHKQNSFRDVHAIAQDLVTRGISGPRQIAVTGSSGGGVLMATAVVQRPDLFGVGIPRVGLYDLLRTAKDEYGLMGMRFLMGDPLDETDAERISLFSAYHLVQDGVDYPSIMFEAGENDHRCPPWHARKTGARLQAATSSDRPVLIRVWRDTGHGEATGITTRLDQTAEYLAFAMRELGMTLPVD